MAVRVIDARHAAELMSEGGAVVLDVREARDYAAGHIDGAVHLGFDGLSDETITQAAPDRNAPVIVYCYVGGRSAAVAQALDRAGYAQVYDLGGVSNWPFGLVR